MKRLKLLFNQDYILDRHTHDTIKFQDAFTTNKEHALSLPTTWVIACAYSPNGQVNNILVDPYSDWCDCKAYITSLFRKL